MVPMARFDSVCEELNNALKREQQAQALLHEQTAQMQEMGERLELHANQGEEKDVTLAEAVKVLCIHSVIVFSFIFMLKWNVKVANETTVNTSKNLSLNWSIFNFQLVSSFIEYHLCCRIGPQWSQNGTSS